MNPALRNWSVPIPSDDGWTFRHTRDSEAVDSYRIDDDRVVALARALGVTEAQLRDGDPAAVEAWDALMLDGRGIERLLASEVPATLYAEWIPGGDFGYYYLVDADGVRRSAR